MLQTTAPETAKLRLPLAKERVIYCQQTEDVVWRPASVSAQQQQHQQCSVVERRQWGSVRSVRRHQQLRASTPLSVDERTRNDVGRTLGRNPASTVSLSSPAASLPSTSAVLHCRCYLHAQLTRRRRLLDIFFLVYCWLSSEPSDNPVDLTVGVSSVSCPGACNGAGYMTRHLWSMFSISADWRER